MKNTATTDILKIVGYIVACFLLAALLTPSFYQIGKGFAEATIARDTADNVSWLASKARKAGFETYFKRMLMLSAVILIVPLIFSLKLKVDPRKLRESRWSIYLPEVVRDQNIGQPLVKTNSRLRQFFTGLALAALSFVLMGFLLLKLGWFHFHADFNAAMFCKAIQRALAPALIISGIEELLFRGALLGIFLRAFQARTAILLLSLLFAAVHFLQPPSGIRVTDPGTLASGFEMLQLIGARFLQPQAMLYEFTTLFLVGLILAHARFGTAALWLSIGLHAGWILAFKVFKKIAYREPDLPEKYDLFIGDLLTEGLIPLGTLLLTWAFLYPFIRSIKSHDPD